MLHRAYDTGRDCCYGRGKCILQVCGLNCGSLSRTAKDFTSRTGNGTGQKDSIPAAHEQMFAKAKSDGIEIHGFAVRINADGSMQCSCSGSTRTSGSKQNSITLNTEKKQKERLEKKREERKILEENLKR